MFETVDEILKFDHSKKAIQQNFPVVLFIMLYKVVQTFESVDEILKCDNSNESYWAVLSCGAIHYAVQGGSNFLVCGWNPKVWPFKWQMEFPYGTTMYYRDLLFLFLSII